MSIAATTCRQCVSASNDVVCSRFAWYFAWRLNCLSYLFSVRLRTVILILEAYIISHTLLLGPNLLIYDKHISFRYK